MHVDHPDGKYPDKVDTAWDEHRIDDWLCNIECLQDLHGKKAGKQDCKYRLQRCHACKYLPRHPKQGIDIV